MWVKVISISIIILSVVFSGFRQIAEKNGVRFPKFDGSDLEQQGIPTFHEHDCGWFTECKEPNPPHTGLWGRLLGDTEQAKPDTHYWYDSLKLKLQSPIWFDDTKVREQAATHWWGSGSDASERDEEPIGWRKANQKINHQTLTDTFSRESVIPAKEVNPEPVNIDSTKKFTIKIVMVPQFRNIWNKAGEMFQKVKYYSEYIPASYSAFVIFIFLPYAIIFWVQFNSKKAVKIPLDEEFPDVLSSPIADSSTSSVILDKPEITYEVSETSIDEKLALVSSDINADVEKSPKDIGKDLEVFAKTVEYLQKKCRQQENQLLKKSSELEEMARTVEYLQKPGEKRWVGLINRVPIYHSRFPAIANMRYYQFHVPVEADGRTGNPEELKIGNSEEELSAREDSDVSDAESSSELEWG